MKKLFILFAAAAAGLTLKADVMYWQLCSSSETETTYNGQTWNAVKVAYVAPPATTPMMGGYNYLSLAPATNPDDTFTEPIDAASARNGYFAVLPDNASSYSYFIELGNYNGTTYTAVAQSGAITYSELSQSYVITTEQLEDILGHISTVTMEAWTGGSYQAVPEPTGGLMVLVGLSVLALRRRKARV